MHVHAPPSLLTGAAVVAGVAGAPVAHSLSPLIHGAWLAELGLDAAYVPFAVAEDRFVPFTQGLVGGAIRGLNVTAPFKREALAVADFASREAARAGSANLLLFHPDGAIEAQSHDGAGLLSALAGQAPDLAPGNALVLGAGGAGRAAAAALLKAGWRVRLANRTPAAADAVAAVLDGVIAVAWDGAEGAEGASLVVNATAAAEPPPVAWGALAPGAAAMDMRYRPLRTPFLAAAAERGLRTVDGLGMLIGQAIPSFEAFFGCPPPPCAPVRALAEAALAR